MEISSPQRRMWLLDRLGAGSAYNAARAFVVTGRLDATALERAFTAAVALHPALRTRFPESDGSPVAVVDPPGTAAIDWREAVPSSVGGQDDWAAQLAGEASSEQFDLATGPVARLLVYCVDETTHVMVEVVHHIACDGPSLGILLADLAAGYAAERAGTQAEAALAGDARRTSATSRPGPDESHEHREAALLDHWRRVLAPPLGSPTLPTLSTRRAPRRHLGGVRRAALPAELSDEVRALAATEGTTPFVVLHAALAAVLGRLASETDVVVGTPVTTRRPADERTIGCFTNTLVLRTNVAGDPSFVELVRRSRGAVIDALDHRDLPFDHLVSALCPVRDPTRSPLFQVLFTTDTPTTPPVFDGLELTPVAADNGRTAFDLTLLAHLGPAIGLRAEFDADLFTAAQADRFLAHLAGFLAAALVDPERQISAVMSLPRREERQLRSWSAGAELTPSEGAVIDLIRRQAARAPQRIAVVHEYGELAYGALVDGVDSEATRLEKCGISGGTVVAVAAEPGLWLLTSVLALWQRGAVYVPIDPSWPQARQRQALDETGAEFLLGVDGSGTRLGPPPDTRRNDVEQQVPAALAYLICTSGSTGHPKAVEIEQRSLTHFIAAVKALLGVDEQLVIAWLTSPSFDISFLEMLLPLTVGGRVCIVPSQCRLDAAKVTGYIDDCEVTMVQATPTMWSLVAQQPWRPRRSFTVLCGGEPLPRALADRLLDYGPVWNMYGPTESTIWCTAGRVRASPSVIGLGRPLPGTAAFVVSDNGSLAPIGAAGELVVTGPQVARGYRNRDRETETRFFADSLGGEGVRAYRTGDRCRWLEDGTLEFLGRFDRQLKIRGHRVEPAELEAHLLSQPQVGAAHVAVAGGAAGVPRLRAYVAPRRGQPPPVPDELRKVLAARLPPAFVPDQVIVVPSIPMTTSGKLDAAALLASTEHEPTPPRDTAPPTSDLEQEVAAVFAELLEASAVGATDNFFALGGNSVLAAMAVARLQVRFNRTLLLASFFAEPTPRAVAGALHYSPPLETADDAQPGRARLSITQEHLFDLRTDLVDLAFLNVTSALRLNGPLDRGALATSVERVVARHTVLHSVVATTAAGPVWTPVDDPPSLTVLDLRGQQHPTGTEFAAELGREETTRGTDLTSAPGFRAQLVILDDDDHALLLTLHHLVADGFSMGVLGREVALVYNKLVAGAPVELPMAPSFLAWAQHERECFDRGLFDDDIAHWVSVLRPHLGGPVLRAVLVDLVHDHVLTTRQVRGVEEVARALATTPFAVYLGLIGMAVGRRLGGDRISIATMVANRPTVHTRGIVGLLANTIFPVVDLDGDPPLAEVIRQCHQQMTMGLSHQSPPLPVVLAAARPTDETVLDLPRVLVMMEGAVTSGFMLNGVAARALDTTIDASTMPAVPSAYDYAVLIQMSSDDARVRVLSSSAVAEFGDIVDLGSQIDVLLDRAIDSVETVASDVATPGRGT